MGRTAVAGQHWANNQINPIVKSQLKEIRFGELIVKLIYQHRDLICLRDDINARDGFGSIPSGVNLEATLLIASVSSCLPLVDN